jgi:hypothetical protein
MKKLTIETSMRVTDRQNKSKKYKKGVTINLLDTTSSIHKYRRR